MGSQQFSPQGHIGVAEALDGEREVMGRVDEHARRDGGGTNFEASCLLCKYGMS